MKRRKIAIIMTCINFCFIYCYKLQAIKLPSHNIRTHTHTLPRSPDALLEWWRPSDDFPLVVLSLYWYIHSCGLCHFLCSLLHLIVFLNRKMPTLSKKKLLFRRLPEKWGHFIHHLSGICHDKIIFFNSHLWRMCFYMWLVITFKLTDKQCFE